MDISAKIAALRELVPERAFLPSGEGLAPLPTGADEIDAVLGGGLRPGGLHDIYAASPRDCGAAMGFALGLAARSMRRNAPLFWLRQRMAEREFGRLHAPGLAEMGIDPGRLVLATADRAADLLDAALQATRGLKAGVVLLEPWSAARELDMTAARRLALAAEASGGGVTLLALFAGREPMPSPALTRWRIAAAPASAGLRHLMGAPRMRAELIRNRAGATGEWLVEWMSDASVFRSSPAVSRDPSALPAHRPPEADDAGGGWRRVG